MNLTICFAALIRASRAWQYGIAVSAAMLATLAHAQTLRPITVRDSIEWTNLLLFEAPSEGELASRYSLPSPNGTYLAVHARRGNLELNRVDDALLYFRSDEIRAFGRHPAAKEPPRPIGKHVTAVTDDAAYTADIHWLDDRSLGFVAPGPKGNMTAWALNAATGKAAPIFDDQRDILTFAIQSGSLVYYSSSPQRRSNVIVVGEKRLPELLSPGLDAVARQMAPVEVFASPRLSSQRRLAVPPMRLIPSLRRIWLSPNGTHAVLMGRIEKPAASWDTFRSADGGALQIAPSTLDDLSSNALFSVQYLLLDVRANRVRPLLDAPFGMAGGYFASPVVNWSSDGRTVTVSNTYIPDGQSAPGIAEIDISSGTARRIAPAADGSSGKPPKTSEFSIELRQSLNERPKLHLIRTGADAKVLFDPNPQADGLQLTEASVVTWTDGNKRQWRGGLLRPRTATPQQKLPLVVQTHGFNERTFLLDGPATSDGGTAFAAQALAAAGIAVLQVQDNRSAVTGDTSEGRNFAEGYRAAIAHLADQGWVDETRVGLIAFSRTGYYTLQLLADHPRLLAAVSISDSFQDGYSEYIVGTTNSIPLTQQLARLTGGEPLGAQRETWFARNPLYSITAATASVRLEENGELAGIGLWETFSLLKRAHRPVDFILYPNGGHVLLKPSERLASQGGNFDWFRFWLQDITDPDPMKAEQYARWQKLRALSVAPAAAH